MIRIDRELLTFILNFNLPITLITLLKEQLSYSYFKLKILSCSSKKLDTQQKKACSACSSQSTHSIIN